MLRVPGLRVVRSRALDFDLPEADFRMFLAGVAVSLAASTFRDLNPSARCGTVAIVALAFASALSLYRSSHLLKAREKLSGSGQSLSEVVYFVAGLGLLITALIHTASENGALTFGFPVLASDFVANLLGVVMRCK